MQGWFDKAADRINGRVAAEDAAAAASKAKKENPEVARAKNMLGQTEYDRIKRFVPTAAQDDCAVCLDM
jgi:hypothetical protein